MRGGLGEMTRNDPPCIGVHTSFYDWTYTSWISSFQICRVTSCKLWAILVISIWKMNLNLLPAMLRKSHQMVLCVIGSLLYSIEFWDRLLPLSSTRWGYCITMGSSLKRITSQYMQKLYLFSWIWWLFWHKVHGKGSLLIGRVMIFPTLTIKISGRDHACLKLIYFGDPKVTRFCEIGIFCSLGTPWAAKSQKIPKWSGSLFRKFYLYVR